MGAIVSAKIHLPMIDHIGRKMRKLRVSLLDACNMRCVYCMPDNPLFLSRADWLPASELTRITSNLVTLGIEEIRLTGGEPTLRNDLMDIVQNMSKLSVQKLGLTTNGIKLDSFLDELRETECRYLNISLDSLHPETFSRITKHGAFHAVVRGILKARDLGFHVKVNTVVLRGINDQEIPDFVEWSAREAIAVRFLEVMNIGVMKQRFSKQFVAAREMITCIEQRYKLTRKLDAHDATAYTFRAENGADIGFIASESEAFCGTCSRLRLTSQGVLRPCLFANTGIDLKPLALDDYPHALQKALALKPTDRISHIEQPMYQIGG